MRLWPRRKPRADRHPDMAPAPALSDLGSSSDPFAPLYGAMEIGSSPAEFEPTGEARVYDDEIDPDWRDPTTAEDGPSGS